MSNNRSNDQLRQIEFIKGLQEFPDGSVLSIMGKTKVLCSVYIQEGVPKWIDPEQQGWATCEYNMLPGSTIQRTVRDISRGRANSRSIEIQRLIGRAIRSVLDLTKIKGFTLWIDCDVVQADGGTRTASINGAVVALNLALKKAIKDGKIAESPITDTLGAVSVGIVNGEIVLDLNYIQDSTAEADMNIVMTGSGRFVEVQATGEKRPFTKEEFKNALELAEAGIKNIIEKQNRVLSDENTISDK